MDTVVKNNFPDDSVIIFLFLSPILAEGAEGDDDGDDGGDAFWEFKKIDFSLS
jgi:hypothetical protein